jgi:hypothetical protein
MRSQPVVSQFVRKSAVLANREYGAETRYPLESPVLYDLSVEPSGPLHQEESRRSSPRVATPTPSATSIVLGVFAFPGRRHPLPSPSHPGSSRSFGAIVASMSSERGPLERLAILLAPKLAALGNSWMQAE